MYQLRKLSPTAISLVTQINVPFVPDNGKWDASQWKNPKIWLSEANLPCAGTKGTRVTSYRQSIELAEDPDRILTRCLRDTYPLLTDRIPKSAYHTL